MALIRRRNYYWGLLPRVIPTGTRVFCEKGGILSLIETVRASRDSKQRVVNIYNPAEKCHDLTRIILTHF